MARIDYYEAYTSKAVAKARKEQIERTFPPQGYGTYVRVMTHGDYNDASEDIVSYVVAGYRYDSCD